MPLVGQDRSGTPKVRCVAGASLPGTQWLSATGSQTGMVGGLAGERFTDCAQVPMSLALPRNNRARHPCADPAVSTGAGSEGER
jgi:hypothetical protein